MSVPSAVRAIGAVVAFAAAASSQVVLPSGQPNPAYGKLWAWFDAANGVNGSAQPLPDGTPVTRWLDRGSGARHLTRVDAAAVRRPTLRLRSSGCGDPTPAVAFDGNDYVWGSAGDIGRVTGPRSVFVVVAVDAAGGGYVFDGSTFSGRTTLHAGESAAPGRWHVFWGDSRQSKGHKLVGPSVVLGSLQTHSIVLNAGAQAHRIAGQSVSSAAQAATFNLGGLVLGSRVNLSLGLTGQIAELLFYAEALSPADRAAVESYLLARHGHHTAVPPPKPVDVFVSGNGYPRYRIPAIIRTSPGTLLAFAEGRQGGGDQSHNDIVLRRSNDGGRTWGALQLLHDAGTSALNNPCAVQIITGRNAGRVLLMYQMYPRGTTIWNANPGYTGARIIRSFLMFSDDDGATWSRPLDVTTQVKPPGIARSVNSGPGIGIQLRHGMHAGRIVFPFNRYDTNRTWGNYAAYSDDGGTTWTRGADVPRNPAVRQGNECQVVERSDGSLLLNSRRAAGAANRKTSISTNGGATWTPLVDDPGLPSPAVMASVLRFTDLADGYAKARVLYSGPASTTRRVNGAVKISYDEGATWTFARTAYPGAFGYSCLTPVDAQRFGLLFERENGLVSFVALTAEWVSRQHDCLGGGAHGGTFGMGCGRTGGAVPRLTFTGCPTPNGCITLGLGNALPNATAVLLWGAKRAAIPFGPCTLLTAPVLVAMPIVVSGAGGSINDLAVPATMSLGRLQTQAVVLDAGAPLGLTASNGVEVVMF